MNSGIIFLAQVFLYAGFPIYLATLKNPIRLIYSYIYISLVLIMGGFLGAVYSLPLNDTISISGGSIAYGALMMSTILLVVMEGDLNVIRNIIRIVIGVNITKFFLFSMVSLTLDSNGVINPFTTASSVFSVSAKFMIIGGVLIISELLLLVFLFEKIKTRVRGYALLSALYVLFFVGVLCLDGILFPLLAFPFDDTLVSIIVGGVVSKFVLGLAYSVPLIFFLLAFRKRITHYKAAPIRLQELIVSPKEELVQEITRRQAAIERSDEQLRYNARLLDEVNDAVISTDEKFQVLAWNKAAERLYGFSKEEMLGKVTGQKIPTEYLPPETAEQVRKTFLKHGSWKGEVIQTTRDGSRLNILSSVSQIKDSLGNPVGAVAVNRDISDRKRAEQALQENENFISAIANITPALIYVYDLETRSNIYANKGLEQITGYSSRELQAMGSKLFDRLIHPDDLPAVIAHESKLYASMENEQLEIVYRVKHRNGSWRSVRSYERPFLRNPDGSLKQKIGVAVDLTENIQMEAALRENEQRFKSAFDFSAIGMALISLEGRWLKVNQKVCSFLGYSKNELMTKSFQELTHPDDLESDINYVQKLVNGEIENYTMEKRYFHKDGGVVWAVLAVALVRDSAGIPLYFVSQIEDITERKQAEITLRQAEQDYRAIFENAPIGIFQSTASGQYLKVNSYMADMYGYSTSQEMLETVQNIEHQIYAEPSMREEFKRLVEQDGYVADFENQIIRKDGRMIWISTNARAVKDAQGQTLYYEGYTSDITERRAAENSLRSTQEILTGLLENAPASIYVVSEDHRYRLVNKGWEQARQISREQALGSRVEDLFPADLAVRFNTDNQRVMEAKAPLVTDETVNDPDGTHHYYTVKFPLRYLTDEYDAVGGFTFDITERIQAEQQRERLTNILEASLNEIYIFDAETLQFEYVNEGARRNLGYDAASLQTLTPLDLKPEFTHATFQDLLMPLRRHEKERLNFETVHRRADGSLYPVDVHLQLVEQGRDSSFLAIIIDITKRKSAEERLKESENKYRQLVETSHDLIWSVDAQGIMTYINQASERIYGYKPEELIGKHWTGIAMDTDEKEAEKIAIDIGLKGGAVGGYISKMRHRSGREVILRANAVQQFDANGNYSGASGISQDVTEIVKANEEVRRSREQLRSLVNHMQTAIEDERAHIARNIHDEFGQMMTGLKMDLAWLERNTKVTAKQQERLNEINHLVDESIKVIRRISSELRPGLLDDLGLLAALEWLTNEYSRRSNLKFSIVLPPQEPDLEPAAKTALFRIFQESITNVIRHAGATQVKLILQRQDDDIQLSVMDNGSGIPLEKLQNPTSLGLLGMQERAAQWGGKVEISGEAGKGTKVVVRLPMAGRSSQKEAS